MMVYATSFFFLMPLLALAFLVIWLFSRTRLAPTTVQARKPRSVEVIVSIAVVVSSAVASWFARSALPYSFWKVFPQPSQAFQLVTYSLFFLLPVVLALRVLGKGLDSVRLTTVNWKFSMVLGFSASVVMLIPTIIAAPELIGILASTNWLYYIVLAYAVFNEELLFRGFFQTRIEGLVGAKGGIILTALVFQLSHFPTMVLNKGLAPGFFFVNAILTIVPPILFGYIAWRSDSLLGSATFHLLLDLPLLLLT
jgi:membrane protease YdiL (CAAX protease family)